MGTWLNDHWWQLLLVAVTLILLAGTRKVIDRAKEHKVLLWFAFILRGICGLVLGAALYEFTKWLTGLSGTFGGVVSSVGAVIAVIGGWWSLTLLVKLIRDVADGVPDEDARKAALLIPTLAPACITAAWSIARHPTGIGTGITAAIIALISLLFLRNIIKSALASTKHQLFWKWFAVVVSGLAGILMIPLLAYVDAQIAAHTSGNVLTAFRVIVGVAGVALLIACIADAWPKKEKGEKTIVPDGGVRAFAALGVPALFLCGALAVGFVSDHATEQGNILVGSMK
jgi:hypothetical protein